LRKSAPFFRLLDIPLSPLLSRPDHAVARWGVLIFSRFLAAPIIALAFVGCGSSGSHYLLVDKSLLTSDYQQADAIIRQAEADYGVKSRVLYRMDRGMTLQLAGEYEQSNHVLEEAEEEVDRLYTRSIRTETVAFMTNENSLPYEGEPYEQVMINVLKALNYASMNQWQDALVEARRIDHRLNVLVDRTKDTAAYRDDGFARYLSGILYESAGDVNDAFIAYRKAHETFDATRGWSRTGVPAQLKADLLRTAEALHLNQELAEYRQRFPNIEWKTLSAQQQLAQVIVISYNGRAPRKEDQFLDLPISLDALQLVLVNRGLFYGNRQPYRAADSVLYGLNGRVVRVALPRIIPQKTQVPIDRLSLLSAEGQTVTIQTELAHNVTALAGKALAERIPAMTVKALARAALKFSLAEGATRGAQHAAGKDAAPWVGLAVGLLTKGLAVASEESDKRSWRTLPDEIHLARVWVPPGDYRMQGAAVSGAVSIGGAGSDTAISLRAGETAFILQRVMQ
jgi:uncharacterized protein